MSPLRWLFARIGAWCWRRCAGPGAALQFATEALQDDWEVVFAAVQQDGAALTFASKALRGNRSIVLAAVTQYGYAWLEASERLQADRGVALAAVRDWCGA